MPRAARRVGASVSSSSTAIVAPGGGTHSDLTSLSHHLGLPYDAVLAIMNCQGLGVTSSTEAPDDVAKAAMTNVWGDWMNEEMTVRTTAAVGIKEDTEPASIASSSRTYQLPIVPPHATPGCLAQTGTLDSTIPGRSSVAKSTAKHDLDTPTILFPDLLPNKKFVGIYTSPSSCHSVAITTDGQAYGWGRNENGQLGLGFSSPVVPKPTKLSLSDGETVKFISAGVGKYHTILISSQGFVYASGGNKCGQLGINTEKVEGVDKFRKCVVDGQQKSDEDGDETPSIKIVHASCGENVSVLLSSSGHLYTSGTSEFGLLGTGETGEYIVAAGKLGYANCYKFYRRSLFVQSEVDDAIEKGTNAGLDSSRKVKYIPLSDSEQICLASISCGKNHIIALEAASTSGEIPRVFTWGSGHYGVLGHGMQADEYTPRLVGAFRGPLFASNHPVEVVAGSNCTMVRTKNGHVYYCGKHRAGAEATMRPALIDALANNGHVVTAFGAGHQTVFCSTSNGVTVSWGQGQYGELGYGNESKSSSKPKFVNGLDSCLVTSLACGMGHTLFLIRNDDLEDTKALKKVPKIEEKDLNEMGEPPQKKQKVKGKKN